MAALGLSMANDLIGLDLNSTQVDSASKIAEASNRALETPGIRRRRVA